MQRYMFVITLKLIEVLTGIHFILHGSQTTPQLNDFFQ